MRDFESDIAELIAAAGLGTIGEDLFIGGIPPDVTGRICTVVISDSVDVLPYVSTDRDQVTAQISVTVRGLGGRDAGDDPLGTSRARAMAALTACHRASTNIYSRIVAFDLPALEWNSNELPEWTFTLELACDSVHAVTELVVLPRDGVLRLVGVSFPDGSTLYTAPPPVDLSGYAPISSPIFTGPVMPATAGQQALGSAAVPWGPVFASAPVGEDALTLTDGARINLGGGVTMRQFGAALLLTGGIQFTGRLYLLGEMMLHGRHQQSGPQVNHNYSAGINGILAGQSSVTITTNMVSGTGAEIQITPRQLDPAIKAWAVTSASGSFTVHVDAPASADWYFSWVITNRHLPQS